MSFIERTCTVVRERHGDYGRQGESNRSHEAGSRPLESFREEPAYVLLGSPGSGKTKAFEHEAQNEGCYITARDFLTFDPDPEWEGRTIYIDGLDEARAGTSDGRTPFDGIRAKLQRMGHPRFRLSCREGDWFGANDRECLKAVAPNGALRVLRLDPLSDQGILDILRIDLDCEDPTGFVDAARQRGVDGLLRNPLNLTMLSAAVRNNAWPRTRMETFDLACRELVSEENVEHQIAWKDIANPSALLDAAGYLCAILLLAGKAGVTLPGTVPDTDHPSLEDVPNRDQPFSVDQQLLRRVVDTNLFALAGEGCLVPAHRQLAEFLAARHLAGLVAKGLPVRRLLALMTGYDGGIISEFRGIAAWLAAHSKPARTEIVKRDPLGVVLYGDIENFSAHEKTLVLKTLREETERNPWLAGYTTLASPLGCLVNADLEPEIRRALSGSGRDDAHQSFVRLILHAIRAGQPLSQLADPLMAIVRDDSWSVMNRCAALESYVRVRQGDPTLAPTLRHLLDDIYSGGGTTRDDDLLGTLLGELYPDDLPPANLVGYLRESARRDTWTRYDEFWTGRVIENSTVDQMVRLLDLLKAPMEEARAKSGARPWGVNLVARPPILLLRHLLENSSECVPQDQLVFWLDFAGWLGDELKINPPGVVSDAEFFGCWLREHPNVQKAIIERGIDSRPDDSHLFLHMRRVQNGLFGARKPDDYGVWCADQALRADDEEVADWFVWEAAAFTYNEQEREPQHRDEVVARLSANARLSERFGGRLRALENHAHVADERAPRTAPTPADGRFDQVRATVRANLASLRANQCPPGLLHHLAEAYLDGFADVRGETPRERLHYLLGSDDDLLDAALAGLRDAIWRADLPTWTEVSKLASEGQTHYMAYPFMVGLGELSRTTGQDKPQLTETQTRLALSIHLSIPRLRHLYRNEGPPRWMHAAVEKRPAVVAEVWGRCARHQLRQGKDRLADTYNLAHRSEYASLAEVVSIPLLKTFPTWCKSGQLPMLSSLLQAAVLHGDRRQLRELIEAKLARKSMNSSQRVYWLTTGLFVKPEVYGSRLESYVSGRSRRMYRLMEMTVESNAVPQAVRDMWDATTLETLIRLIGPYSISSSDTGSVTLPMQADWSIHGFIHRLSEDASSNAGSALASLAWDDGLVRWRSKLLDGLHRQRNIFREATFTHPRLEQVAQVLGNGRPANAADLWALATDALEQLAREVRDGATSDWRQYWNVDSCNRAQTPKPENACRDALLSDLRRVLALLGIEAAQEGVYADDKRSDIRLSVPGSPGFNVPVEIKRSCHRKLWSAIHAQLAAKYTRDPGADGYGIYLVFWFGETEGCRPTPRRSGPKPKSASELQRALLDSLSDLERRKISVCVVDVSKPNTPT